MQCNHCGAAVNAAQEICPFCKISNPGYNRDLAPAQFRRLPGPPETAAPAVPAEPPPAPTTTRAVIDQAFDGLVERLAAANRDGCKVIANIGFSESGKSWFVARMGRQRGCAMSAQRYSLDKPPEPVLIRNGEWFPRTPVSDAYVWQLDTVKQLSHTHSGNWRVVDIAGEQVGSLDFNNQIARGKQLHDVLLMTLAHASALVLMVDGCKVADALTQAQDLQSARDACVTDDDSNALVLNELIRIVRFIDAWREQAGGPPQTQADVQKLREAVAANGSLDLKREPKPLLLPTLLLISKADALIKLQPESAAFFARPGPDPTRLAAALLGQTHAKALQNFAVFRWGFVAPFVGQPPKPPGAPSPNASEYINFGRPSYGVNAALAWLDNEISGRHELDAFVAQRALHRVRRWLPRVHGWRRNHIRGATGGR